MNHLPMTNPGGPALVHHMAAKPTSTTGGDR